MGERFRAGKRLWETSDDEIVRRLYADTPTVDLARQLGRSMSSVYLRARSLGLSKSKAYMASPAASRLRRGDNVGLPFRFKPGHEPANKGLRRPGYAPGRMGDTQFRPGQLNGQAARNYMPIGSTRLIDGYVYRKVTEVPNMPYSVNWKAEHVLLWEAAHGPVPPGHTIAFQNGNKLDLRLENLECITRRQLMARNSVHNLPAPLPQTIQLLGALRRQIRRTARAQEQNQ